MKVSANGGDFQQPEPGTYLARCVRIIDIGTQPGGEYQGKPRADQHKIILMWELPDEPIPTGEHQGEPFLVSRFYTASLNEKATLRHDLVAWRTREFTEDELEGFEMHTVLGAACMVTVTLSDTGKTRVSGVSGVPRSMKETMTKLTQVNPSLFFSLEPGEFDQKIYDGLSDGIKRMVDISPEMKAIRGGNGKPAASDYSDIDFHGDDEGDDGSAPDDSIPPF